MTKTVGSTLELTVNAFFGMIGHVGGGALWKCSKTINYKTLLITYFVQTCS